MGDSRYERHLARLREHGPAAVSELADDELIQALAALAAQGGEDAPYLANVLASEAMNRLARSHAAIMHTQTAVLVVDLDGAGVFANPAAETLLGWTQRELRGVHLHTLVHDDEACRLERALDGRAEAERAHTHLHRKDGADVAVDYTVAPVIRDGTRTGTVLALQPRT